VAAGIPELFNKLQMKRNINLQELSKDHHHGLLFAWKIRQGLKNQASFFRIKDYILYFFNNSLLSHFKEEETVILPFLADENDLKQKVIKDHRSLEAMVSKISVREEAEDLLQLAELLEQHIRFEERSLFPFLQQQLTDVELDKIGSQIENNHLPFVDSYADEFWKLGS